MRWRAAPPGSRRGVAWLGRAALLALLAGCWPEEPPWPTAAPDDDDAYDDDDDVGAPRLDVSPSTVRAGAVEDITLDLGDFAYTRDTVPCCGDQVVVVGPGDGPMVLQLFFGLLADGPTPWGLAGTAATVETSFDVTPLTAITAAETGFAAALPEAGSFEVRSVAVTERTMLSARAVDPVTPYFRPRLWLLGADGATLLARGGEPLGSDTYAEPRVDTVLEPGSYFLRIDDAQRRGGPGYGGTVQIGRTDWSDAVQHDEVEPNEAGEELGVLLEGTTVLHGVAETSGHDMYDEPAGDRDVFRFRLPRDARVRFRLDWEGVDDFDAVLFDDTWGASMSYQSEDAIDLSMLASSAHPEVAERTLPADRVYALMVVDWAGTDGTPWTLEITVLPEPWSAVQ